MCSKLVLQNGATCMLQEPGLFCGWIAEFGPLVTSLHHFLRQIGYPALAINIFKIFFVGYSVYAKENVFCVGAWSVHKWGDRFACSIPGIQP